MAEEKTMVNIYLPALERSVTGSIVSMIRFMPETESELRVIGADVFDLTKDLAKDFCATLTRKSSKEEEAIQEKFKEALVADDFNRAKYKKRRVFNLVIEGENAIQRIDALMGDIRNRNGVTILGRYGFIKKSSDGKISAIEFPASAPKNQEEAEAQTDLVWNKHQSTAGGPTENSIVYPADKMDHVERSVVLVKPNAFNNPNDPRLGDVMDTISRTGMYIIGAKVQKPTQEQTQKFYEAHKDKEFFDGLVDFMSEKKSLALLYEGVHARKEIRHAALTVIRDAYSDSKLENTVHTSENEDDFKRESEAVNFSDNHLI